MTKYYYNGTLSINTYILTKNFFKSNNANLATFHNSETACPLFSNSLLQYDKSDQLSFFLYYQNINSSLAKQDDAIRTEISVYKQECQLDPMVISQ